MWGFQATPYGQFRSAVDLVEVYATATDRRGEPVTDLTASEFHVREDGRPQTIAAFTSGDVPLSIVVALDRSFSMAGDRLKLALQAARGFVGSLRSSDQVEVVAIGSEIQTLVSWTPASAAKAAEWTGVDPWGTTPLFDATIQSLDALSAQHGRRALVVISDGGDRDSRATAADTIERARQSGVLVYPVAIGGARPPVFVELASVTGGRTFFVNDPKRLEMQLATLARELRSQYLIGYAPPPSSPGAPQWHAIDVAVDRPGVTIRARDGYFSR